MHSIAKILQDMGYEVHYASNFEHPVYPFSRQELETSGIVLHDLCIEKSPSRIKENLCALKDVVHILKTEQIECIHAHSPVGGMVGRLAGLILGHIRKEPMKPVSKWSLCESSVRLYPLPRVQ